MNTNMMLTLYQWFASRFEALRASSERGASAVEYGLLVALIATVILGAVTSLGFGVRDTFCAVNDALPFAAACTP